MVIASEQTDVLLCRVTWDDILTSWAVQIARALHVELASETQMQNNPLFLLKE